MEGTVEVLEDGFFHPLERFSGDEVDAHHFHHVGVAGLPASVQFVRARVKLEAETSEQIIIGAYAPVLTERAMRSVITALAPLHEARQLSFAVQHTIGHTRLIHGAGGSHFAIAAAAATWLCFGSWDESDPILVEVDERAIAVSMEHRTDHWHARLSDVKKLEDAR